MRITILLLIVSSIFSQEVFYKGMGLNDWVKLDDEFGNMIIILTKEHGSAFNGHGGLAVAPEAFFKIDDNIYEFYGGFIRKGNESWKGKWMNEFWQYRFNKKPQEISSFIPAK